MRGAAVLTRTSVLWLIGLAAYVVFKGGAWMRWLSDSLRDVVLLDPYYVVADVPYMIATGSFFVIFAAFYYWCERTWGRRYDDRLGKAHFAVAMAGMALMAAPQVALFLLGTPRRYADYGDAFRTGAMVSMAGFVIF